MSDETWNKPPDVKDYLLDPEKREIVSTFKEEFSGSSGEELFCGITEDGLVVGVRFGGDEEQFTEQWYSNYYKVWAFNLNLPPNEVKTSMLRTTLSYGDVDTLRDGGTRNFPSDATQELLQELVDLPEEELKEHRESTVGLVRFYKMTGGFQHPAPRLNKVTTVGDKEVKPIPEV